MVTEGGSNWTMTTSCGSNYGPFSFYALRYTCQATRQPISDIGRGCHQGQVSIPGEGGGANMMCDASFPFLLVYGLITHESCNTFATM